MIKYLVATGANIRKFIHIIYKEILQYCKISDFILINWDKKAGIYLTCFFL